MIAMVLAAGLGTRLRPWTERIPKPALPILGSSLLRENLRLVAHLGASEVVVNAHHLPEQVAAVAKAAAEELSLTLHLSFEQGEALGTGGALGAARPLLEGHDTILLVNGDVLTDMELAPVVTAHRADGADATLVLRPMPQGAEFAPVDLGETGEVLRIAGLGREGAGSPHLFTGIHLLGQRIFDWLPRDGASCVNRQGHVPAIAAGRRVVGEVVPTGSWSDVGTPARYKEANLDLLSGAYRLPGLGPVEGVVVEPGASVSQEATLRAPCWIGAGAVVEAGAVVGPRAVALPGARVAGSLVDDVAFPEPR
jgi:mannose-1-phosphate guanylyltransferase